MAGPLLLITGAAGAGKTTATDVIAASMPGVLAVDGDVIGAGAHAVHREDSDYDEYWGYVVSIMEQIAGNGLVPLVGCLMRPSQLLANDLSSFTRVSMLAFVCDADVRLERIVARGGGPALLRTPFEEHTRIDQMLRTFSMPPPHTYDVIDTSVMPTETMVATALEWVRTHAESDQFRNSPA